MIVESFVPGTGKAGSGQEMRLAVIIVDGVGLVGSWSGIIVEAER